MLRSSSPLAAIALLAATPAHADQAWVGIYEHDMTFARIRFETGQDIKVGWIGEPIDALRAVGRPAPHFLVSRSLKGQTDYMAAGLNWKFGTRFYARPGIGVAVHNGPSREVRRRRRVDLGSRVIFAPELALGWQASQRIAVEASWIHLSHATLFSEQNRGMDSMGVRVLVTLP